MDYMGTSTNLHPNNFDEAVQKYGSQQFSRRTIIWSTEVFLSFPRPRPSLLPAIYQAIDIVLALALSMDSMLELVLLRNLWLDEGFTSDDNNSLTTRREDDGQFISNCSNNLGPQIRMGG